MKLLLHTCKRQNSNSITYEYTSPHLEEGFPGNLKVQCKYQIHKNSFKGQGNGNIGREGIIKILKWLS